MKKRLISIFILTMIVLSIITGCKIQSVDEYHKTQDKIEDSENKDIGKNKVDSKSNDKDKDNKDKDGKKESEEDVDDNKKEEEKSEDQDKEGSSKGREKADSDKEVDKNRNPKKSNSSANSNNKDNTGNKNTSNKNTVNKKPAGSNTPNSNKNNSGSSNSNSSGSNNTGGSSKKYVTITIRVDTILKNKDKLKPALNSEKFVPSSGVILGKTRFELGNNENVFDILVRATRSKRIHMEYQGASQNKYGSVYVQGINNIYEFDCGELSGWMYNVNGKYPNVGADKYVLKDGDNIEWRYTCDLGRDLGVTWLND